MLCNENNPPKLRFEILLFRGILNVEITFTYLMNIESKTFRLHTKIDQCNNEVYLMHIEYLYHFHRNKII